jgi:hypothetical protein
MAVGGHIACLAWLAGQAIQTRSPQMPAEPMVAEIISLIKSEAPTYGVQFVPTDQTIQLDIPELPIMSEPEMTIDAPRIDATLTVDIRPYSERAELQSGIIATILLLLEISPEGSVLSAQIVRSNASDAANAAAIEYAHATHWMPGKIGGEPRAMQASLTVILGERI